MKSKATEPNLHLRTDYNNKYGSNPKKLLKGVCEKVRRKNISKLKNTPKKWGGGC
jgi:hypothetical protein